MNKENRPVVNIVLMHLTVLSTKGAFLWCDPDCHACLPISGCAPLGYSGSVIQDHTLVTDSSAPLMYHDPSEYLNTFFLPSDCRVAISPSISHPNPQCNNKGQTTTPGTSCPTLFDKRGGSFTSPANSNIEDAGDGAYGL